MLYQVFWFACSPMKFTRIYSTRPTVSYMFYWYVILIFTGNLPKLIKLRYTSFILMGLCGGIGVLNLVISYRLVEPSILAPFEYFGIPISFILGWLFLMKHHLIFCFLVCYLLSLQD